MKKIVAIIASIAIVVVIGLALLFIPTKKINIKAASSGIDRIYIFSGTTGEGVNVTDASEIEKIVNNIKEKEYKLRFNGWKSGYIYRLTFYEKDKEIYSCIMNSNEYILKPPFAFVDKDKGLCFDYLGELMEKYKGHK